MYSKSSCDNRQNPDLCLSQPDCRLCGFYGFAGLWLCCTLKAALTDVPVLSAIGGVPAGCQGCCSFERIVVSEVRSGDSRRVDESLAS